LKAQGSLRAKALARKGIYYQEKERTMGKKSCYVLIRNAEKGKGYSWRNVDKG